MGPPGTTPEQPVRLAQALAPVERCELCRKPTLFRVCVPCAEALAEQKVFSHE